jgi:hypothetical protein
MGFRGAISSVSTKHLGCGPKDPKTHSLHRVRIRIFERLHDDVIRSQSVRGGGGEGAAQDARH